MQIKPFPITLEQSFMITPKVKHFVFKADLSPAFHYLPGQFITIHFEHQGKPLKRSYSIANSPTESNRIEFAAGFFSGGPGTELLFHLQPNDTLWISGPYGRLIIREEIPDRYILVATSTGITPYRAMMDELSQRLEQYSHLQIVVLQGVQKREEILYATEFFSWAEKYPQVTFRPYLSRTAVEELLPNEYSGHVQNAFLDLDLNPKKDLVYLCGNPDMIDEAFQQLKERGFEMQQIIREKYISR